MAYVWCRVAHQENPVLVGTGHIVGNEGTQPPGIRAGQFAVSFQLPPACIADSIVVTDSRDSKAFLENVTVLRC